MNDKMASSGTIAGIYKLICEFYCGSRIAIEPLCPETFKVFNAMGEIKGARIIKERNRYVFYLSCAPKTMRVLCPLKDPQRCSTCKDEPCDGHITIDF